MLGVRDRLAGPVCGDRRKNQLVASVRQGESARCRNGERRCSRPLVTVVVSPHQPVLFVVHDDELVAQCSGDELQAGRQRRGDGVAPCEALTPQEPEPVRARVVLAQGTELEVLLDRAQQAVVVVSLGLHAGLDPVAEQHGVDLVGAVVGVLGGEFDLFLEVGLVEGDDHKRAIGKARAGTGEPELAEERLEPLGRLVDELGRPVGRLAVGASDVVAVVPHVRREPRVRRQRASIEVGKQLRGGDDALPACSVMPDVRERRERVVLGDIRVVVARCESGCPLVLGSDVGVHIRPPLERLGRLLDEIDDCALRQRSERIVAGDIAQLTGDRRDVVRL